MTWALRKINGKIMDTLSTQAPLNKTFAYPNIWQAQVLNFSNLFGLIDPVSFQGFGFDTGAITTARTLKVHDVSGTVALLESTLNAQTGTTYTFVAGDNGKVVTASNASAQTYTVPQNSTAAIPIGAYIEIIQLGAGQVTLAQGSGATLNSRGGALKIAGQYGVAGLRKISTNGFIATGDLTT